MRLPDNHVCRLVLAPVLAFAASTTSALAGHSRDDVLPTAVANGPSADFPVTVGDAYSAGGATFVPADTMNLDAVGYATVGGGDSLVSAAHHTLPVPSYVEVTSLESGRTILVRVDRRGPMDSANLIELSPAAAAQLGLDADHRAVRVRRVNPPEAERALLRAGAQAPERIPTPKALLAVLNRKLDPQATVALARSGASGPAPAPMPASQPPASPSPASPSIARAAGSGTPLARLARSGPATRVAPPPAAIPTPVRSPARVPERNSATIGAGASYADFDGAPASIAAASPAPRATRSRPALVRAPAPVRPTPEIVAEAPAAATGDAIRSGMLVIQAGAFSVRGNAQALASKLGAQVAGNGKLWRVRVGPFASRDKAEAALAKVHAAGYSEARIQRAD